MNIDANNGIKVQKNGIAYKQWDQYYIKECDQNTKQCLDLDIKQWNPVVHMAHYNWFCFSVHTNSIL